MRFKTKAQKLKKDLDLNNALHGEAWSESGPHEGVREKERKEKIIHMILD